MHHRTRAGVAVAAITAILLAGGLALGLPASAAPQDFFLNLTSGNVTVGEGAFDLPEGGGFNGTWDDETGDLAGTFLVPTIVTDVATVPGAEVTATFVQQGEATGSIDPDTGAAAVTAVFRLDISVALGGSTISEPGCHVAPITLDLTGTYDHDAGTVSLSASGFTIPPSEGCAALGSTIDDFISGDPTEAVLNLERVGGPIVEPPPPSSSSTTSTTSTVPGSTTTAPAPTAPPAAPVNRDARFTG